MSSMINIRCETRRFHFDERNNYFSNARYAVSCTTHMHTRPSKPNSLAEKFNSILKQRFRIHFLPLTSLFLAKPTLTRFPLFTFFFSLFQYMHMQRQVKFFFFFTLCTLSMFAIVVEANSGGFLPCHWPLWKKDFLAAINGAEPFQTRLNSELCNRLHFFLSSF